MRSTGPPGLGGRGDGKFKASFEIVDTADGRKIAETTLGDFVASPASRTMAVLSTPVLFGRAGSYALRFYLDGNLSVEGKFSVSSFDQPSASSVRGATPMTDGRDRAHGYQARSRRLGPSTTRTVVEGTDSAVGPAMGERELAPRLQWIHPLGIPRLAAQSRAPGYSSA